MKALLLIPDAREAAALQAGLAALGCQASAWVQPPSGLLSPASLRQLAEADAILVEARWQEACSKLARSADTSLAAKPVVAVLPACDLSAMRQAFSAGADEVLFRPLGAETILLRMLVCQWRHTHQNPATLELGTLRIDAQARRVSKSGRPVDLTAAEWRLLTLMLRRRGTAVPRTELEALLLAQGVAPGTNRIEVHMSNLRRKLLPGIIQTDRGMGYRIPL